MGKKETSSELKRAMMEAVRCGWVECQCGTRLDVDEKKCRECGWKNPVATIV